MKAKRKLLKVIDEVIDVRCAAGPGILREELWEDATGAMVRYNLAFINHFLFAQDNGRVLGYDNSHGRHHRHFKGTVQPSTFVTYQALAARFYNEFEKLREELP